MASRTQDGVVPQDALRRRSVTWIVSLATVGLVFDGYDLVVYGTVVPCSCATRASSAR